MASEQATPDTSPYDALLLVSFGGPEAPEHVVPFLENVTRGRGIPRERLEEVGAHYFHFGGWSPINDQNRAFLQAIREDFAGAGIDLPVYWGNRNWDPYLAETIAEMARDGVTRAACFLTSAYSSYSGCRQYRENLFAAAEDVDGAPRLDRLRLYFNHPGFLDACLDATLEALAELPDAIRGQARLAFVTHSLPETMNASSGPAGGAYTRQHEAVARIISDRIHDETGQRPPYEVVFCSRSGDPRTPWLEPDVNDHLESLAGQGVPAVVMVPIGFVSDHMEVVWDLDTEAKATAERLGIHAVRAATAGLDPRFVRVVRDLLLERAAAERGDCPTRASVGAEPPNPDRCAPGCCPNPRAPLPAVGGQE